MSSPLFAEPPKIDGRELFEREWIPGDTRSHSGDGLGPLFNDSSCVACHNQGGAGGGGSKSKNALLVTVVASKMYHDAKLPPAEIVAREREALKAIHAGFAASRSIVLHLETTDESFLPVQRSLLGENFILRNQRLIRTSMTTSKVESFEFVVFARNTTALFGSGSIDAIADDVLLDAAKQKYEGFPDVTGRVARLKDGRIGKFGWKAQTASLGDFVRTACAVELGLQVPGVSQAVYKDLGDDPLFERLKTPPTDEALRRQLDLTDEECDALTGFVAGLPAPRDRTGTSPEERHYLAAGYELFGKSGCANCHTPKLGEAIGIYSDLLLHDMGDALSDSGSYGRRFEDTEADQPLPRTASRPVRPTKGKGIAAVDDSKLTTATRNEWRTPPLWGVRDSAPYLHDGRADTLEQAINMHGGEAESSIKLYERLSFAERLKLTTFLKSLQAPK
jgi:CxxC motif-containing protein (DUF1111 family)